LRMLYTLLTPDHGSIQIDSINAVADPIAARGRLGVVPDSRGLYKRLSTRENILYYADLQGVPRGEAEIRVEQLVKSLDMGEIIDRRTDGFSQGQRVKVAIARALVHAPHNIVLDEPTNGLDVMATRALRRFMRGLKDAGHCVLFSSHIMQEVAALCDRVIVIAAGRVVAAGSLEEIRQQGGTDVLEDAFVKLIGSEEGLNA
jgi:sodium transport system ATP-binding protein